MNNAHVAQMHGGQPGLPYDNCGCLAKRCKAYSVVIELEIQRVTCPGVWLCNNGRVTMQIFLLGLCTQTSTMVPSFPLLCHEKFIFRKNFANIKNLVDIDRKLDKEIIYMELIQWEDCTTGNVLATFKTTLNDLLYPFPCMKGVVAGVDVDLLMEATRIFPGIIAPKIEISTKLTIEEVLCSLKQENQSDVVVINPKLISSKCVPKRSTPKHQKKVCHNKKYHTMSKYPPHESPRHPRNDYRSYRESYVQQKSCGCTDDNRAPSLNQYQFKIKPICVQQVPPMSMKCNCKGKISCPLCAQYKNYFPDSPDDDEKDEQTTVKKGKSKIPKPKPSTTWKDKSQSSKTPSKSPSGTPPKTPPKISPKTSTKTTSTKNCSCREHGDPSKPPPCSKCKPPPSEAPKTCTCRSRSASPSNKKGSNKDVLLCACDGVLKPVCNCKACKGCPMCEAKSKASKSSKTDKPTTPKQSKTGKPTTPKQSKTDKPSTPSKTKVRAPEKTPSKLTKKQQQQSGFGLPRANSTPLPGKDTTMCDTSANNNTKFYQNLETFYKQLYLRAHNRLRNEICRCEGESNN